MRWLLLGLSLLASAANAQTFRLLGFLEGRETYVKAPPSWTQGGYGRFDVGADNADDHATHGTFNAQLGAEWTPTTWLTAHAQVLARSEPSGTKGKSFGWVEAYVEAHTEKWRLRAGEFFLPTSRENTDALWTSPYTITWSALNTWMGQEVRPVGADLQFAPTFYTTFGATAFRDNDTMGTLPANRGWTMGSRLTVYDEEVAVPPPGGSTKPISPDLDGKWGFSERVRLTLPEQALIQITHLDNRAELVRRRDLTPWQTEFNHVGAQLGTTGPATLAAEWMSGKTTVGFPGGTFTLHFRTEYLLGSYKPGHERLSVRVERFSGSDGDSGHAWTIAAFHEPSDRMRAGLEYVRVNGTFPFAASAIGTTHTGGSTLTAELRYRF